MDALKVIDKFNNQNFNLWKFKIKIMMASMDLWYIVNEYEEPRPSKCGSQSVEGVQKTSLKATNKSYGVLLRRKILNTMDFSLERFNFFAPLTMWNTSFSFAPILSSVV